MEPMPSLDLSKLPSANKDPKDMVQSSSTVFDSKPSPDVQNYGLSDIGVLELLESDERAVFVLDLTKPGQFVPVYTNPKFRTSIFWESEFGKSNLRTTFEDKDGRFSKWVEGNPENGTQRILYCGFEWSAQTLRGRWRVIAGDKEDQDNHNEGQPTKEPQESTSISNIKFRGSSTKPQPDLELVCCQNRNPYSSTRDIILAEEEKSIVGTQNIFASDITSKLSPHVRLFLDFEWADTELGPINSWPIDLQRMCNILMTDSRPGALCWGTNRTTIYNEAYALVTGQKHPNMMGQPISKVWAGFEINEEYKLLMEKACKSNLNKATMMDNLKLYIERENYLEETYHSLTIFPFATNGAPNVAFYLSGIETTRQVIADRRIAFLLGLEQEIAPSREPKNFWEQLIQGLESDHPDLTYVLLYSASSLDNGEVLYENPEPSHTGCSWTLEGCIRVPDAGKNIPKHFGNENCDEKFISNLEGLLKSSSPTLLSQSDWSSPGVLFKEFEDTHDSSASAFLPIRSPNNKVLGFLIVGLNPNRQFDDEYRLFMQLLSRQIANSMAAAVLVKDEIRRGQVAAEQASQVRNRLLRELEIRAHEAVELGNRFRKMSDLAPVAIYHLDASGSINYANDNYYKLTNQVKGEVVAMSWCDAIYEPDVSILDEYWGKMMNGESVSFEIRLKAPSKSNDDSGDEGPTGPTWIISAGCPEKADDGTITGFLGCLTDISRQKWAEDFQKRKMLEAVELKRQQENFIDMTSHEMRNPLSAIIQCADMITVSVTELNDGANNIAIPRDVIHNLADAASTIALCAQHQKRIIDDILTLSKMDSDLFFITPIEVQPLLVVKQALKMFDSELQKTDVTLESHVDGSFNNLNIAWLKLDPSRLLQVLINLITNAIKFTQSQKKRNISITVGASLEPPPYKSLETDIVYYKRHGERKPNTQEGEWGNGEVIYLHIKVQDSGRGLNEEEQKLLFQRFSQASPRTHVKYGGSGLGLFISRELTELQGGQIGLKSSTGVGSTFAFYIRARRCNAPEGQGSRMDLRPQRKYISSPNSLDSSSKLSSSNGISKSLTSFVIPKNILIVEDNIVNQNVLRKQLHRLGCTIHVANHGLEALDFLEKSSFATTVSGDRILCDVLLMDLEMPIMDGLTCVGEIRKWERSGKINGRVPVIALTANARREQIETALEAGVDRVVTKPFRIGELVTELQRWGSDGGNSD